MYWNFVTSTLTMLAFLTSPGRMAIGDQYADVAAGIERMRVPWFLGTPRFKLSREGVDVVSFSSAFPTRHVSD
jgi:hypothetical protein